MRTSQPPADPISPATARQYLLLDFVTMPSGGTFTVAFNGRVTAPIPWNASADAVQLALQATAGNYRIAVLGGPFPSSPYVVVFLGDYATFLAPLMTIDITNLTGGTGVTGSVRYLAESDWPTVATSPPATMYEGNTAPDLFGTFNFVEVGNTLVTLDGNGSLFLSTTNANASLHASFFTSSKDLKFAPVKFLVHNPQPFLCRAQLVFSNSRAFSGTNTAPGITIPPGWTSIIFHGTGLSTQNTCDMRKVNAIRFFVNSETQQDGLVEANDFGIFLDSITVPEREEPCVMIGWDDGLINVKNIADKIIKQYPGIKHTLFVVKSWAQSGKRNFDNSPTMVTSQIKALYESGQYLIANHSAHHYRFEAGINPNYTGATATEQAVRWRPVSGFPTGGTFRLTIDGYGTTNPIPYNASIKQLTNALAAIVGEGNVAITSWMTLQLSSSFGLRVVFASPMPIMTVSDPDGQVNATKILAGPAFSVADIVQDYEENRQWLLSEGMTGGESIIAYPEGSYGPTVHAAMQVLGARGARIMISRANGYAVRTETSRHTRFSMPAFDFQGGVPKLVQQLEAFSIVGGGFSIMLHDIGTNNSNPNISNQKNLETLLQYLSNNRDRLTPMTYKEYFDSLDLGPPE